MKISDQNGSLALRVTAIETYAGARPSDYRLSATLRWHGFTALNRHLWVSAQAYDTFAFSLNELDRSRRGLASLSAMSPNEFLLVIEVVDLAGHVQARGHLANTVHDGRLNPFELRLPYSLDIDPSKLPKICKAVAALPGQAAEDSKEDPHGAA
jgi:hypothetical protein